MSNSTTAKLIAGGAWVQVKVMMDGVLKAIGMAQGCSYDEDWGIQPANCLNHLGPISYDSQNYSCSITMQAFVPEKKTSLTQSADGGEVTIADLLPTRDEVQAQGKGRQYDQMVFMNTATAEVMNQFEDVILASNGAQVNPNNYVTSNARFNAVKRSV